MVPVLPGRRHPQRPRQTRALPVGSPARVWSLKTLVDTVAAKAARVAPQRRAQLAFSITHDWIVSARGQTRGRKLAALKT